MEPTDSLENPDIIDFYSSFEKYFEFSNFYLSSFYLDSQEWKSVEHYFQAQKTLDIKQKEKIRNLDTPREAKRLGRKISLRPDWEEVKMKVMEDACRAKFTQIQALRKLLLSTGEKKLREHTKGDRFWGDGGGNKGLNQMGRILMKLRGDLRKNL